MRACVTVAAAALVRRVGAVDMRDERAPQREAEAADQAAIMSDRCRLTCDSSVAIVVTSCVAVIKATFSRFRLLVPFLPLRQSVASTSTSCSCPSTSCNRHQPLCPTHLTVNQAPKPNDERPQSDLLPMLMAVLLFSADVDVHSAQFAKV